MVSLGSITVLASVALPFFFQQIVSYPERYVAVDANGTLPRVITYGNSQEPYTQNGEERVDGDELLAAAVNPFLFGNGTDINFNVFCPTGNCTWAPYESLAVCGSCADVSQLLVYACLSSPGDWLNNATNATTNTDDPPPVRACGYYLNATTQQPVLVTGVGPNGEVLISRAMQLNAPAQELPYGTGSINFKNIRNPIADFIVAGTAGGSSNVYSNSTPVANECVLYWCTKTFTPTYEWGQLNENPSNVFFDEGQQVNPWRFHPTPAGATAVNYYGNVSITPIIQHPPMAGITYGLSNVTALQALLLFNQFLPSYVTSNGTESQTLEFLVTDGPRFKNISENPWLPPNNVSAYVERFAKAMTDSLRANSNETETVLGTAYVLETFVQIRWAWLSLPILVLMMSLTFLVATIIQPTRDVGTWKNSFLAGWRHGPDNDLQRMIVDVTSPGGVKRVAPKIVIEIVP